MDKSNKICKYQLKTSVKATFIYYSILIGILLIVLVEKIVDKDNNIHFSGVEISTAIFIFVAALNSFKSTFYFSQGNNVSRKTFIKGNIKYGLIMSAILSVIDIVLNRVYNIFTICPTNFHTIYGKIIFNQDNKQWQWAQTSHISSFLQAYIWYFALYAFLFMLGLSITIIYFRLNKLGQVIISIIPVIIIVLINELHRYIPDAVFTFFQDTFQNPYRATMMFIILAILGMIFQYMLIKKAVPDKN